MQGPRAITILATSFKLTAGIGALFVDAAANLFSHFTCQCYAMHRLLFGAFVG
jgi:hypothetical protein